MKYEVITYIIFSFVIAFFLSKQTDKKILSFTLILYIFAQPALTFAAIIDLPGLPFDLQPNRIFLLLMLVFFVWPLLVKSDFEQINHERPAFEKYLYIYLFIIIISLIFRIYTSNMTVKYLILRVQSMLLFFAVYYVVKREVTSSVLSALLKAVVTLSIFASIVAVYQILFDSSFLRLHHARPAFGGLTRSSAMFNSEYMFGYFINFAIIVAFLKYRGRPFLYFLLPLLIIALITTFHRMSWITFIVCSCCCLFFLKRFNSAAILVLALTIFSCVISITYFANPDIYSQIGKVKTVQSFSQERLSAGNLTGRMQQNYYVIKALLNSPMGLKYGQYYSMMKKIGFMKSEDVPYDVHNGYLGIAVSIGLPAMLAFVVLLASMLVFFLKHIKPERPETVLPVIILMIWLIANLTNYVSGFGIYFSILIAIICGSFVSMYNKNLDISTFLTSEET